MQTKRLPVYVPAEGALATIDPRSGIVGSPAQDWLDSAEQNDLHRIVLDYEGNRFNASNIVTFADRVRHAADRHAQHYPTVARAVVDEDQVVRVGMFDPERGRVEIVNGEDLLRIASWIDVLTHDALRDELRCTRVFA